MVACDKEVLTEVGGGSSEEPPTVEHAPHVDMAGVPVYIPPGPVRQSDVPENLLEVIQDGVAMMESTHLEKSKCGGKRDGWKKCLGDYIVAASDIEGNLMQVEAYENKPSSPANFSVRCERNDGACDVGVNVPLIVEAPPGWTVVAIRTAIWDKQGPDGISGAVYVPYTSRLNTPELRLAGLEYLTQAVETAHQELVDIGIPSQYIRGTQATDWGTTDHVLTLILTEQMRSDFQFVEGSDDVRTEMLNRTLTILGANQELTSSYSRSSKGAAGLAQLMPRTYRELRKQYPDAGLLEDHVEGRVDHCSAIRAAIVHTDSEWWPFRGDKEFTHREFLKSETEHRRLVFAAGYNWSIGKVDFRIDKHGAQWRSHLPTETERYLIKYEWLYGVLFNLQSEFVLSEEFIPSVYEPYYDNMQPLCSATSEQ